MFLLLSSTMMIMMVMMIMMMMMKCRAALLKIQVFWNLHCMDWSRVTDVGKDYSAPMHRGMVVQSMGEHNGLKN